MIEFLLRPMTVIINLLIVALLLWLGSIWQLAYVLLVVLFGVAAFIRALTTDRALPTAVYMTALQATLSVVICIIALLYNHVHLSVS